MIEFSYYIEELPATPFYVEDLFIALKLDKKGILNKVTNIQIKITYDIKKYRG